MIYTFSSYFGVPPTIEGYVMGQNRMRQTANSQLPRGRQYDPMTPEMARHPLPEPVALAYVSKGNWWARCPLCTYGCEFVDPEVGLFWCFSCRMITVQGRPLRVQFPVERQVIEMLLEMRTVELERNWRSDRHSVNDLIEDNVARGLMVMVGDAREATDG